MTPTGTGCPVSRQLQDVDKLCTVAAAEYFGSTLLSCYINNVSVTPRRVWRRSKITRRAAAKPTYVCITTKLPSPDCSATVRRGHYLHRQVQEHELL